MEVVTYRAGAVVIARRARVRARLYVAHQPPMLSRYAQSPPLVFLHGTESQGMGRCQCCNNCYWRTAGESRLMLHRRLPPLASAHVYGAQQFGRTATRRLSVAVLLTDTQAAAGIPAQTRMAIPQFTSHAHEPMACWHVQSEPMLVAMAICTHLWSISGVRRGGWALHVHAQPPMLTLTCWLADVCGCAAVNVGAINKRVRLFLSTGKTGQQRTTAGRGLARTGTQKQRQGRRRKTKRERRILYPEIRETGQALNRRAAR